MRLTDGFRTRIAFSLAPLIKLYHVDVTPPGVDGGGPNDITVMENDTLRTRYPKKLKTLTEAAATYQYSPAAYVDLIEMINVNQVVDLLFSDGSIMTFFGWLNSFKPNPCKEGEAPTAVGQIIPSNVDVNLDEVLPTIFFGPNG